MSQSLTIEGRAPLLSVGSLHALTYCERLFYLEEVERIRVADAAVFAGRTLHVELDAWVSTEETTRSFLEDETLGLCGAVDVLRRRDGVLVPYEHKRGRATGEPGDRKAWLTDRIQVGAYAMLIEAASGEPVPEGRVRYHADGVTVRVPIDLPLRLEVEKAIARARCLSTATQRPPVTDNERLCSRCSLAPVCLPEESRLAADPDHRPIRLFPPHATGRTLHVCAKRARVGRRGEELVVHTDQEVSGYPICEIGSLVLHGFAQITTQALRLCSAHDVGVHWMTMGGGLTGSLAPTAESAQRHIRQFEGLRDEDLRRELARRLVMSKIENQLRFVLRATRGGDRCDEVKRAVSTMREMLRKCSHSNAEQQMLGYEGNAARAYFSALRLMVSRADVKLQPSGRSQHPPRDRFNAVLSYSYGMLYREVLAAIVAVGLHPGFGFYHRPRSAAHTLALDVMELFRVTVCDVSVVAAVNRGVFEPHCDFKKIGGGVYLTESGRRKVIRTIENRRLECWRHPVLKYSLSYARLIEVEVRLLEKEWSGEPGLFARMRMR